MNPINLIKILSKNINININMNIRNYSLRNYSLRNFSTTKIFRNESKKNENKNNIKVYTSSDEWIYNEQNYKKIGLTKNAIHQLTELVYIDFLIEPGDYVEEDEELIAIEGVKTTATINAPFDLILVENNIELVENLTKINEDPENINTSWIIKAYKN